MKDPSMTHHPIPPETLAWFGGDELRARIFHDKYALRDPQGTILETTPPQMWDRIAAGVAAMETPESARLSWYNEFRWLLHDFRFIPGGRIMAAIGNSRKVTALNCYCLPLHDDSLEAIFRAAAESARTHASGGGSGIDISRLRPKGSPVRNAARTSSGAVSFMELFSTETGMIGQQGRRGAMMLTIADSHPDVFDFCHVKRNQTSVKYANISIRLSDAFMRAVEADDTWLLHYENRDAGVLVKREIRAKELWRELITGARDWAEPGTLFWDTIERRGTSQYNGMSVISTNPCAEEPLEAYGACDLGSLNLLTFVKHTFANLSPDQNVDWPLLNRAVRLSVRFLDNILDWNRDRHPLQAQEEAAAKSRRIGLGVTGLADMLAALRLTYGSPAALEFTNRLFENIRDTAYAASIDLSQEKGPFPGFDSDTHLHQPFLQDLPTSLQRQIDAHGLRNVALLTVPPAGTGSALAGVSSGIEPIFSLAYTRRSESLSKSEFHVLHPLAHRYWTENLRIPLPDPNNFDVQARAALPDFFVTAHTIDPSTRIDMQAVIQRSIDAAISGTVNLPHDTTVETIDLLYRKAWDSRCKGITVFREGSRSGILLTPDEAARQHVDRTATTRLISIVNRLAGSALPPDARLSDIPQTAELDRVEQAITTLTQPQHDQLTLLPSMPPLAPRPKIIRGVTHSVDAPEGRIQVTINEVNGEPFELICHGGKAGSDFLAYIQALSRCASMLLRLQRPCSQRERLELLIDQWKHIAGSRSSGFGPNKTLSGPDAIAKALQDYLALDTSSAPVISEAPLETPPPLSDQMSHSNGNCCPQCRRFSLITDHGCLRCRDCSYREC